MSNNSQPAKPRNVEGIWYFIRRVPARFAKLDKRAAVKMSTRIRVMDDPDAVRARQVVQRLAEELYAHWVELEANWARETARRYGFDYIDVEVLAIGPLDELIRRLLAADQLPAEERVEALPAIMGLVGGTKRPVTAEEKAEAKATLKRARRILEKSGRLPIR